MNPPRFNTNDKVRDALGRVGRVVVRRRIQDGFLYSVAFAQQGRMTEYREYELELVVVPWSVPGGSL